MPEPAPQSRTTRRPLRLVVAVSLPVLLGGLGLAAATADTESPSGPGVSLASITTAEVRSLDGSANNPADPSLGAAGQIYPREAAASYADGVGQPETGPPARYLSNRIFNDTGQNVFSENDVTHWSFVWGQFVDHTIGLRESGDEDLTVGFDADDPLERFTNDLGTITTTRSAAADGTGVDFPREQINTVSSFIDGWAVYGGTAERLDWLRDGLVDGDPTNNEATLLDVDGYLPTAAARTDFEAPTTDLMGRLFGDPEAAVIAGDTRVNENIGLTAVHTLFLREHNRIVASLPDDLTGEEKFQIARRLVSAMQQYVTYNEFLPAMGVALEPYEGYDSSVDPSITNEFATVGYRAHSQIHGEFEAEIPVAQLTDDEMAALGDGGLEVSVDDDVVEVAVPLNVAFGNPALVSDIGLGNLLAGLGSEAAYANDEQIDDHLRSVLFQLPGPDVEDPLECLDGTALSDCFTAVNDLGALDVVRGYDHGIPSYNDLRESYGLARATSFADLTGETTEEFPDDPTIDAESPIDDPDILDFVSLADGDGNLLEPGSDAAAATTQSAVRRTTTAARLKAVFGDVDAVDAFTGMVSEPHVAGTEFGELQLAMWTRQFTALRDGDRFFYGNDPVLDDIAELYGVDHRVTLAELIAANTDIELADLPADMFVLDDAGGAAEVDTPEPGEPGTSGDDDSRPRPHDDRRGDRPRGEPGGRRPRR